MGEKNKGLIVITKTFFRKVKDFFISLLEKNVETNEVITENFNEPENIDENEESEKDRFFKGYNDYKSHKIETSELSGSELIKMNSMLEEEVKMNQEKLFETMKKQRDAENNN